MKVRLIVGGTYVELLGLIREEMIEGLEYGGVAAYFDAPLDARVNLLI